LISTHSWPFIFSAIADRWREVRLIGGPADRAFLRLTATLETVRAGKRPIEVVRVRITDAGRLALAG
jgi:hypothetical protein